MIHRSRRYFLYRCTYKILVNQYDRTLPMYYIG
nr:MAG TPA: Neuromedin U [Bacteriophage sp.]